MKPGTAKGSIYTTLIPITKDNAATEGTCWKLARLKQPTAARMRSLTRTRALAAGSSRLAHEPLVI